MVSHIIHSKYVARVGLEIDPQCCALRSSMPEAAWWRAGVVESVRDVDLTVYRCPLLDRSPCFIFIDQSTIPQAIQYLHNLCEAEERLPYGGLVFIDQLSGELIETNFDPGETEEWADVLEILSESDSVLLTFSATDVAVEIRSLAAGVTLQNLDWGAAPNRLDSSRQDQPIHVFGGAAEFVAGVLTCLHQLAALQVEVERLPDPCARVISDYLSVRRRRAQSLGQP
jgi:hypothetical protein